MRLLFTTILLFCQPAKPEELWQAFRSDICDDLVYQLEMRGLSNVTDDMAFDYGLYLLNQLLQESGKDLTSLPAMPLHQYDWDAVTENPLITEQLNYNREQERDLAAEYVALLNAEQREVYEQVMRCVHRRDNRSISEFNSQNVFFLDGHGGTGKTFVYKTLCHALRAEGKIVLCVASTGIAALILPGGRTAHSMFKIPINGLTGMVLLHSFEN